MSKPNKNEDDDIIEKFQKNTLFSEDDLTFEKYDSEDEKNPFQLVLKEEKIQTHENDTLQKIFSSFLEEVNKHNVPLCEFLTLRKIQLFLDELEV